LAAAQVSLPVPLSQRGVVAGPREASRFAVAPFIDANQRNGAEVMPRSERKRARLAGLCSVSAVTALAIFAINARAEQPPAPCHPNPTADADETAVRSRGDVVNLPGPLQDRLAQLANRPHTYLPLQVFNEADGASQLFQYYLLDTTGFEPNVFTAIIPGVNDGNVQLTATGGNCGLPTVGAVRVVLEPKPGFRPIQRIRVPLTMSSLTFPRCSSSTMRAAGMKGG